MNGEFWAYDLQKRKWCPREDFAMAGNGELLLYDPLEDKRGFADQGRYKVVWRTGVEGTVNDAYCEKDRLKLDIYQGHIILQKSIVYEAKGVVIYNKTCGCFCIKRRKDQREGEYIYSDLSAQEGYSYNKVIGHVFENPELLDFEVTELVEQTK